MTLFCNPSRILNDLREEADEAAATEAGRVRARCFVRYYERSRTRTSARWISKLVFLGPQPKIASYIERLCCNIIIITFRQYTRRSSSVARRNHGIKQTRNRKQCVSRQWMDGDARKLRRIGSIKEICFQTSTK